MVFLCSCGGLIWENRVHVCGQIRCSCGAIKFNGRGHCCGYTPDYSVPPTNWELYSGYRSFDEWMGSTTWGKRSPSLFNTKNQEKFILNVASSMEDIKNLQQTGAFQDYCKSFDFLLTKVILSEDYATSLFVEGLNSEIKWWVKLLRPKTLEEAYEKAKNHVNFLANCEYYKNRKNAGDQILSNHETQIDEFENRNEILETCEVTQEIVVEEVVESLSQNLDEFENRDKIQETCVNVVHKTIMEEVIDYGHKTSEDESIRDECSKNMFNGERPLTRELALDMGLDLEVNCTPKVFDETLDGFVNKVDGVAGNKRQRPINNVVDDLVDASSIENVEDDSINVKVGDYVTIRGLTKEFSLENKRMKQLNWLDTGWIYNVRYGRFYRFWEEMEMMSLKIFGAVPVVALLFLVPVNVSDGTLFFLSKELVEYDMVSSMRLSFIALKHKRAEQLIVLVQNMLQVVYNANKFARLVRRRHRLQNWLDYNQLKFGKYVALFLAAYNSHLVKDAVERLTFIWLREFCNKSKVEHCGATQDLRSSGSRFQRKSDDFGSTQVQPISLTAVGDVGGMCANCRRIPNMILVNRATFGHEIYNTREYDWQMNDVILIHIYDSWALAVGCVYGHYCLHCKGTTKVIAAVINLMWQSYLVIMGTTSSEELKKYDYCYTLMCWELMMRCYYIDGEKSTAKDDSKLLEIKSNMVQKHGDLKICAQHFVLGAGETDTIKVVLMVEYRYAHGYTKESHKDNVAQDSTKFEFDSFD